MPHPHASRHRLALSLLVSLLLHAALLGTPFSAPGAPALPPLEVSLPEPVTSRAERPAAEPLLKDTLAEAEAPAPRPPRRPGNGPAAASAGRKLAGHVYYPPEAVAAGLEGEVRLLVVLDAGGRIVDVSVAASSGHTVLDAAAQRAAWATGRVDGGGKREMLLPVVFRLR